MLKGSSLVDNSFAVPGATGCGAANSSLVDHALNSTLGLPSPAGRNVQILTGNLSLVEAQPARERE
jgi:hypothetical protein